MTIERDPETILAAWLDEGPEELPRETRRAILTALPTIPQARRGPFAPRRPSPMSNLARLAAAAIAAAVVVVGGAAVISPRPGVGGGTPSPNATALPTTSAAIATPTNPPANPAVIDRRAEAGYTLTIPAGWHATAGANALTLSLPSPLGLGYLWEGALATASNPTYVLNEGTTASGAITFTGRSLAELLASEDVWWSRNVSARGTNEHSVTVDGAPAYLTEHLISAPDQLYVTVLVIHAGRAYDIQVAGPPKDATQVRAAMVELLAGIHWT